MCRIDYFYQLDLSNAIYAEPYHFLLSITSLSKLNVNVFQALHPSSFLSIHSINEYVSVASNKTMLHFNQNDNLTEVCEVNKFCLYPVGVCKLLCVIIIVTYWLDILFDCVVWHKLKFIACLIEM